MNRDLSAPVGSCDCVPDEVLLDPTPAGAAQLSAIAAQYKLVPTPVSTAGSPTTYRMRTHPRPRSNAHHLMLDIGVAFALVLVTVSVNSCWPFFIEPSALDIVAVRLLPAGPVASVFRLLWIRKELAY